MQQINDLVKAMEAGSTNAAPGSLVQGSALQIEDLSPVMENVCIQDKQIKMLNSLSVKECKSTLAQFDRQLSYGILGGTAQYEGGIGRDNTGDYVRVTVPMAYYSTTCRTSVQGALVATITGEKMDDKNIKDATQKLALDLEFDIFNGNSHFSNGGVFDGNPLTIARIPNMRGLDQQLRESDGSANSQDLMFAEFGGDTSIVLPVNGNVTQSVIEDAAVRSAMNHGNADKLYLDPVALSFYNKLAHAKERIMLGGSAQEGTGAMLRTQWTSAGAVSLEGTRFLSGKTSVSRSAVGSPAAPASVTLTHPVDASSVLPVGTYTYMVTACNELGESAPTNANVTSTGMVLGDAVSLAIASVTGAKYYNIYRSVDGGTRKMFIGRVASTTFVDLGHKAPGFSTGYLVQSDTMGLKQLSAFSQLKLAISDLSVPTALYRFITLGVMQPRKNVILDNINGQQF